MLNPWAVQEKANVNSPWGWQNAQRSRRPPYLWRMAKSVRMLPMIPPDLLEILACPVCRKPLVMRGEDALKCNECKRVYPIRNGIPILLEQEATIEQL